VVKNYVKNYVKSQIDSENEEKHYSSIASGTVSSTGVVQDCSVVGSGTTGSSRVGDAVRAKSLDFTVGFVGGDATNFCRATIIQWKMNDSNDAVTLSDVYVNYLNNPTLSLFSPTQPNRFRVLFDKIVVYGTGGVDAAFIQGHLKLNSQLSYNVGANSGINHIYLIISSDSTAATHPSYTFDVDFCFTDA